MRNFNSTQPWASMLLVLLAFGNSAHSLSFMESMTGVYSRTAGDGPVLAADDTEVPAEQVRQEMAVRGVAPGIASVSFYIGSAEGSRPSCSGENLRFVVIPESQSLVYPLDQLGCTMKLSVVQGGGLKFEAEAVCSVELCGAGNSLNQDGDSTLFNKKQN